MACKINGPIYYEEDFTIETDGELKIFLDIKKLEAYGSGPRILYHNVETNERHIFYKGSLEAAIRNYNLNKIGIK